MLAEKRLIPKYGHATFTLRCVRSSPSPPLEERVGERRPFFHRLRKIIEIALNGTASRELNACAITKTKKIIGSHRNHAATVFALAAPALRCVWKFGFSKKPRKSAGPSFAVNAYTSAARNSTVVKLHSRLKSSSENSQRAFIKRGLSIPTAINPPITSKSVCQPQNNNATPIK